MCTRDELGDAPLLPSVAKEPLPRPCGTSGEPAEAPPEVLPPPPDGPLSWSREAIACSRPSMRGTSVGASPQ